MSTVTTPSILSDLAAKTVIITGGAGGIGAETVRLFHKHGANVVIADLLSARQPADALAASLGSGVTYVPADITKWEDMLNLFAQAKALFGSIEIVVANAGVMETQHFFDFEEDENGDLKELNESHMVIDVNLKGTMNTCRMAVHQMSLNPPCFPDGSRGSIILVSSTSGYVGGTGVVSYVASKHGVMGLLRASQSAAIKHEVRINAVAPFFTPTYITSGYAEKWRESGLLENSTSDVAFAIARTAISLESGNCFLVVGKVMKEVEGPGQASMVDWFGEEIVQQMVEGAKFLKEQGGYKLPPKRSSE